jgi:plasmid stabilization system protein ParE
VQFIAEHPEASERTDDPAVRVKIVRRYRYKIFYSIGGDVIEIVHVRHASRRRWRAER